MDNQHELTHKQVIGIQAALWLGWFSLAETGGLSAYWMTVYLYVLLFFAALELIAGICLALAYLSKLLAKTKG